MHCIFITGTSSGIGKALAQHFLETDETCQIVGFARRDAFSHERYTHIHADLANEEVLKQTHFSLPEGCTRASLVNNAGVIGDIKRIGMADDDALLQLSRLNVGAVMVLTNRFLRAVNHADIPCTILNISSGAANYEIDAWAPYCASKAAVDHFSRTVAHEQAQTKGKARIFSVAPGIIDTEMQVEIRSSNPQDFSRHQDFIDLKNKGELTSPQEVAPKLAQLLTNPSGFEGVNIDVRDM